VLDMGEPVRIVEVADRMIKEANQPIEIVYTGLRKGEKLDEILFNDGEPDLRLRHPLISHVPVPPLHPGRVAGLNPFDNSEDLVARLARLSTEPGLRASDQPRSLDIRSARLESASSGHGGAVSRTSSRVGNVWEVVALPLGGGADLHFGTCPRHRRKTDRQAVEHCGACSSTMAAAISR
jgi:Polysaccharide biosynthesis protein